VQVDDLSGLYVDDREPRRMVVMPDIAVVLDADFHLRVLHKGESKATPNTITNQIADTASALLIASISVSPGSLTGAADVLGSQFERGSVDLTALAVI
jgi:hypothetical protein